MMYSTGFKNRIEFTLKGMGFCQCIHFLKQLVTFNSVKAF